MAWLVDSDSDRFLSRRLVRIYPTYWLAVALTLIGKVALFGTVAIPGLVGAVGALSLLPFAGKVSYVLSVEWTLVYEVFFYAVCAPFT
jgi:exopolysaccharide production protein ExoZ